MNLIISNQAISTHNGLFSLNDLHKVSGGADKYRPTWFLRNDETKELIAEIESENQIAYDTVIGKGKKQGTYACRELVYRYAMWISPKFSLMVIRAFDAMNTGAIPCLPPKTTADDRTALRQAVSMLVGKKAIGYDEAYRLVHQYMGVSSIDEIALDDLPKAVAYVHSLVLADTHNHNDHNAFWRMVGLLECDRINRELIALQKVLDTAQQSLNHIVKTSGLLYDGFGEQYLPTKAPVVDEARAFIARQMAFKIQLGMI